MSFRKFAQPTHPYCSVTTTPHGKHKPTPTAAASDAGKTWEAAETFGSVEYQLHIAMRHRFSAAECGIIVITCW